MVLLLAVAVQVGTGLFATDDIFNEGPLNRYRLTSLLNPNLARKDDHRLARDANVFIPNLNFHEARAAGTLERPHLPFAKLLRPVGREESVSAAGHGVFVGACPRPEVSGVEIVVTHTGSGDQHAVNRIMRLVQRPEIRCQVDQHLGIGNLQHQYVRFLVVCGVFNHLDAKRGQQPWGRLSRNRVVEREGHRDPTLRDARGECDLLDVHEIHISELMQLGQHLGRCECGMAAKRNLLLGREVTDRKRIWLPDRLNERGFGKVQLIRDLEHPCVAQGAFNNANARRVSLEGGIGEGIHDEGLHDSRLVVGQWASPAQVYQAHPSLPSPPKFTKPTSSTVKAKQRCYPIINNFNVLGGILEKSDHQFWRNHQN